MTARSWLYFNHRCDSHLLRFLLRGLLFFHAEEEAEEGARSDHTYRSRPPPSAPPRPPQPPVPLPSVRVPLRLQLHNSEALNLRRGVNLSPEKRGSETEKNGRKTEGETEGGGTEGGLQRTERRGEEKRK